MIGPSTGTSRCFRYDEGHRSAVDLVSTMVSGDLLVVEDRWAPHALRQVTLSGSPTPLARSLCVCYGT